MNDLEAVARQAAREAGDLLRSAWRGQKIVHFKGAVDLVTETDREAERLIVERLRRAFPDHRIVAEEGSGDSNDAPSKDGWTWFVDPLDGTTNFAHGHPHFTVSLAAEHAGVLELGIVLDPLRDELFIARRGAGATLNGDPIQVSSTATLDGSLVGTGFPYDRRERTDYYLGFVADVLRRAQGLRRAGTASLDLCYVACGRLDAFWELKLKPWDTAAGALIVREAGGVVSSCDGTDYDVYGEQVLATNGHVHAEIAAVLGARLIAVVDQITPSS